MIFKKKFADRLFLADDQAGDLGFIAFVIPEGQTPPAENAIDLKQALANSSYGTFVFSAIAPPITDQASADDFLKSINNLFFPNTRYFIWLLNPTSIETGTVNQAELSFSAVNFQTALEAKIIPNALSFSIQSGMKITLNNEGDTLLLSSPANNNFQLLFSGPDSPTMMQVNSGTIPFSGPNRGCIQFTGFIQRQSLYDQLKWGFQFLIPDPNETDGSALSEWLPFADGSVDPTNFLGFNISIDPSDPFNIAFDPCKDNPSDDNPIIGNPCNIKKAYASRRTYFDFTGKDFDGNPFVLDSFYKTTYGAQAVLTPAVGAEVSYPARFVFSQAEMIQGNFEKFHICPEGDFIISIPEVEGIDNHFLTGGLSGTEFFTVTPKVGNEKGDILRFLSRQPAFIKSFPYESSSPVGPPTDPTASPFDDTYVTSWATIVNNSAKPISYVSQPKGAALFGLEKPKPKGADDISFPDLFVHNIPGFQFSADDENFFPFLPYSGVVEDDNSITAATMQQIEKTVISPQRRLIVNKISTTNAHLFTNGMVVGKPVLSTTPSGLIAKTTESDDGSAVQWNQIQLGWNEDDNKRFTMAFDSPPDPLVTAMQSSDVFMVATNNEKLGDFQNVMSLSSWEMQANIGVGQKYNDYKNVMIFKGRKGQMYNPKTAEDSLVANPKKWTQSSEFAIPQITNSSGEVTGGDNQQLVVLSQWLQNYFEYAQTQAGNPYFDKFNKIAVSPTWTGILFLKVDIQSLPENLKGLTAGITDQSAFNAHHLGIEISPVRKDAKGPVIDKPSSIFGLIYYVDPDFSDTKPVQSIAPTNSNDYNFRLLSLKVLFENTAVKSFESYAQLTLNKFFDTPVTRMANPENIYNNVLLAGSLQINNGKAVYSLGSQNDDAFYLDSNIINKVEITNVLLSTRSAADATTTVCWFGMTGFIDFFVLTNTTEKEEDSQPTLATNNLSYTKTKAKRKTQSKTKNLKGSSSLISTDSEPVVQIFDIFSFGNKLDEDKLKKGLSFANLGINMSFPASNPTDSQLVFDTGEITFDLTISTPRVNSLYLNMVLDMDSLVSGTKDKGPKDEGYLDVIPDIRLSGVSGGAWNGLRFKLNMGSPGELAGKVNLDSFLLLSWSPESNQAENYKAGVGISLPGTGGGAKLISLQNVMKLSIGQIRLSYITKQNSFLLLFTEIALKFLGLLKIPPSGNTLFYLFGNPNAGGKASGLGWYAMFSKDDKSGDKTVTPISKKRTTKKTLS